jgi:hypothetical protein
MVVLIVTEIVVINRRESVAAIRVSNWMHQSVVQETEEVAEVVEQETEVEMVVVVMVGVDQHNNSNKSILT